MDPDHRQSNYWQPPDETPDAQPEPELGEVSSQEIAPEAPSEHLVVPSDEPVYWTALEHIPQERNKAWFAVFGLVTLVFLAIALFLINSWSFTVVIVVAVASVIVYVKRPPREITYTLSDKGLHVGDKLYALSEYKSFGIIKDGDEYSVMLIPVKRFMPGLTVYFPQDAGESIVDSLAYRLPMEELKLDLVDRLVRKLRL